MKLQLKTSHMDHAKSETFFFFDLESLSNVLSPIYSLSSVLSPLHYREALLHKRSFIMSNSENNCAFFIVSGKEASVGVIKVFLFH